MSASAAKEEDVPAAEAEPTNVSLAGSAADESKLDEKDDPGDGLPNRTPDAIEFKWNTQVVDKKTCDTQHMLYLLQLALDLVRRSTIERNKHFKSIGRTDRYIEQLDNPQIISNFLLWHNQDTEKHKFDGDLLEKGVALFVINDLISGIGTYCLSYLTALTRHMLAISTLPLVT